MRHKFIRTFSSFLVLLSLIVSAVPLAGYAQSNGAAPQPYASALTAIEEKAEARRKELGIPGIALAIVKDDEVIYLKGLGYKDFEKKLPVTPDTQFAIGSSTKAFTGLTVLMTADDGKLSLDDSPRTVLPYFKMADEETDKSITIRDLLTHSSGLNRTDIAMITGRLNREELIRVAGEARPIAKLRETFGYQNLMYTAAGEVVAVAQKQPWERFVPERIFKPLGMTNSNMSVRDMEKAKDRSFGYNYNFDTKATERLPYRNIDIVGPAGSINSSARDMAQWVRFILNGGVANGKRLVSEEGFAEWFKPHMKVAPNGSVNYGLGWFLRDWNGMRVVEHGGNIDGFNALVGMIPEKNVGFVLLTNVSGSPLGNELMSVIWENLIGKPKTETPEPAAIAEADILGRYRFEQAGFDIEIKTENGDLVAIVPQQPTYKLERVEGSRYRLGGAPDGFFMTFRKNEVYLEQPHGNFTLPKAGSEKPVERSAAVKELIGRYLTPGGGGTVEVKEVEGKVSFVLPGQPPYALVEREKDVYRMNPLPDAYFVSVKRNAENGVEALVVTQPEGKFEFKRAGNGGAGVGITIDELMAKVLEAAGGEENLRKLNSRVVEADLDMVNQGVRGSSVSYAKAPNMFASESRLTALGKEIATGHEFFDGKAGQQLFSFAPVNKYAGKRLEDARLSSDFYGILNWKTNFPKVQIINKTKCGDEECYVVEFEPEKGSKFTDHYSATTFLLKRRQGSIPSSTSSQASPYTVTFEDYREVDGVMIPFRSINETTGNGKVITTVRSVKHNVEISDSLFRPKKLD